MAYYTFLLQEYEKLITMDGSKLCTTRPPKLVTTDLIYSWCEMLEKGKSDLRLFYILQQLVVMVLLYIKNQVHILLRKDRTILSFSLKLSLFSCAVSLWKYVFALLSLLNSTKNEKTLSSSSQQNTTCESKERNDNIIIDKISTYVCVLSIHCGVLHSECLLLWIFFFKIFSTCYFPVKDKKDKISLDWKGGYRNKKWRHMQNKFILSSSHKKCYSSSVTRNIKCARQKIIHT